MSTIYTCTEPKDAWALVSHFLANQLLVISGACEVAENDDRSREKADAIISRSRAELIGSLYMLVRRMDANGHHDDADKIHQILDMVTDRDVTNENVRQAIHEKNRELNAVKREFDAAMSELRSSRAGLI